MPIVTMRTPLNIIISLAFSLLLGFTVEARAEAVRVAAASDLKFALEALADDYARASGHKLDLTFGSSGLLATQILHGAPFQLFLSADESYVAELHAAGKTQDAGELYALGRLVLIAPKNGRLVPDPELKGVAWMLQSPKPGRFAIANPEHAPYGKRAEEVLRARGLWQALQPHLVLGENVSQAAQFATSGSAVGGIVALSLAKTPQLESRVNYVLLPDTLHQPLRQRMVLMKNAGPVAKDFYRYLQQPAARAVLQQYGFELPQEPR